MCEEPLASKHYPHDIDLKEVYHIWFSSTNPQQSRHDADNEYLQKIRELASFSTIKGFWRINQHVVRSSRLPVGAHFFLFKDKVYPLWEDTQNKEGGRVMISIKKKFSDKIWEDLTLAFIGSSSSKYPSYHNLL